MRICRALSGRTACHFGLPFSSSCWVHEVSCASVLTAYFSATVVHFRALQRRRPPPPVDVVSVTGSVTDPSTLKIGNKIHFQTSGRGFTGLQPHGLASRAQFCACFLPVATMFLRGSVVLFHLRVGLISFRRLVIGTTWRPVPSATLQ